MPSRTPLTCLEDVQPEEESRDESVRGRQRAGRAELYAEPVEPEVVGACPFLRARAKKRGEKMRLVPVLLRRA